MTIKAQTDLCGQIRHFFAPPNPGAWCPSAAAGNSQTTRFTYALATATAARTRSMPRPIVAGG